MSVLEQQDLGLSELLKCKMHYLQAQNTWMQRQYAFLCRLIELQKQLIHSDALGLTGIHEDIAGVIEERRVYLDDVRRKGKEGGREREMEVEDFVPLIYSFQEKIGKLQRDIKERQASLQTIELAKDDNVVQKKLQVKCISSYESNSRLLDRIRREITTLKFKKARLENDLLALNEKKDDESTQGSAKLSRIDEHTINQEDPASAFERVVMLIKKKRYQNSCLEDKIAKFRGSIAHKKAASAHLKREIQGMQWNCLDGFVGACGFVEGGEHGDLSLVGKSFANNTSFSFDVSRFIRPNARFRVPEN